MKGNESRGKNHMWKERNQIKKRFTCGKRLILWGKKFLKKNHLCTELNHVKKNHMQNESHEQINDSCGRNDVSK